MEKKLNVSKKIGIVQNTRTLVITEIRRATYIRLRKQSYLETAKRIRSPQTQADKTS